MSQGWANGCAMFDLRIGFVMWNLEIGWNQITQGNVHSIGEGYSLVIEWKRVPMVY